MRSIRMLVVVLLPGVAAFDAGAIDPRDAVGVYITWRGDPLTTATVNWVDLYEDSGDTIHYRATGSEAWHAANGTHAAVADSVMRVHRVELTGLDPDTVYEFVLEPTPPKNARGALRFRTLHDGSDRPIRFVTGGDMMHSRTLVDAMNRVAGGLAPDFALLGGDLAYANDVLAMPWVDWLQSRTLLARDADGLLIPMVVVIGNHEVSNGGYAQSPMEARYYYDLFSPIGGSSSFAVDVAETVGILALDSHHSQPVEEQAAWLEEAFQARRGFRFLFAVYHYPAYGTTKAPMDGLPCDAPVAKLIREHWVPLFERYGLTASFENDHHTFKRTHRIRGHKRDDANGILYLGDGCWGVQVRPVPDPGSVWYLARAESVQHLWLVTLDGDVARFEAVDSAGDVFDRVEADRPRPRPVQPGDPIPAGD